MCSRHVENLRRLNIFGASIESIESLYRVGEAVSSSGGLCPSNKSLKSLRFLEQARQLGDLFVNSSA